MWKCIVGYPMISLVGFHPMISLSMLSWFLPFWLNIVDAMHLYVLGFWLISNYWLILCFYLRLSRALFWVNLKVCCVLIPLNWFTHGNTCLKFEFCPWFCHILHYWIFLYVDVGIIWHARWHVSDLQFISPQALSYILSVSK